jgi:hypothetical protein
MTRRSWGLRSRYPVVMTPKICGGLISGYTAILAAFVGEEKLDRRSETVESAGDFQILPAAPWQDIRPGKWRYTQALGTCCTSVRNTVWEDLWKK